LIGSFSELLGKNFNPHCLRYGSWFEAFPYLYITDAGGGPLKAEYLHHYSCGWGPLWEQGTERTHYSCY